MSLVQALSVTGGAHVGLLGGMAPALHTVGELWARADPSIAERNRASSIAPAVLERLPSCSSHGAPSAGCVVAWAPDERAW